MFVWTAERKLSEFQRQMPGLSIVLDKMVAETIFFQISGTNSGFWLGRVNEIVDFSVMEKAEKVAELPAKGLGWSNVGSWDSLFEVLLPEMNENIGAISQKLALYSYILLIYGIPDSERLLVTIGVDEMAVVKQKMNCLSVNPTNPKKCVM